MDLDVIAFGSLPRDTYRLAGVAEQAGFSGFWITEGGHPAFNAATAAALATSDITIGTAIAVAFARSPMVTAQAAWELPETTNGQFILGLGTQVRAHVERRYSAAFDAPGPRMREYVAAVRAIFAAFRGAAKLDFSGDFYSFSLLPPEWSPGLISVADPNIYVAGVSPWMLRMIGEHADGLHVHPLHSVRYLEDTVLPALAEGAASAGRDYNELAVVCPVMTAVSDDEDELHAQREQIRQRLAFYGSTPGYGGIFAAHGWTDAHEQLRQLQREKAFAQMSAVITDDMLDAFAVTTSWDGLADALRARYGGRADRVICYSATPQWGDPAAVERWASVARDFR